ncbi:MAG: hypothetical protein AABZ39_10070 [Spirochaetota bacterium]
MSDRKRLDMKLSNTEKVRFKKPFSAYLIQTGEDNFLVGSHELGFSATGKTLTEASQFFKAKFIELAVDLEAKERYAPLTGKERDKLALIKETCEIIQ